MNRACFWPYWVLLNLPPVNPPPPLLPPVYLSFRPSLKLTCFSRPAFCASFHLLFPAPFWTRQSPELQTGAGIPAGGEVLPQPADSPPAAARPAHAAGRLSQRGHVTGDHEMGDASPEALSYAGQPAPGERACSQAAPQSPPGPAGGERGPDSPTPHNPYPGPSAESGRRRARGLSRGVRGSSDPLAAPRPSRAPPP
uniref:Uncharacterized protein n=1 Tax=Rangifer tarandus platyrhynchus TaxID=3082113 RepID=A0ACB0E0H3_RANTA|nr:unnamed protein product [Rangifer tarandus platyrhynchus]